MHRRTILQLAGGGMLSLVVAKRLYRSAFRASTGIMSTSSTSSTSAEPPAVLTVIAILCMCLSQVLQCLGPSECLGLLCGENRCIFRPCMGPITTSYFDL